MKIDVLTLFPDMFNNILVNLLLKGQLVII